MTAAAPSLVPARALSAACGLELDSYRADHVAERVRRAVAQEGVTDERALARLLAADRGARARFRRAIAVPVTGLFRDPGQFDVLDRALLPPLLAAGGRLSVWSAGCADGSELRSVALVLERRGALAGALLLGTDVLERNVAAARRAGAPAGARARWQRHDLLREPAPPGEWRLVLCRNVAIYLSPPAKDALHRRLAAALAPDGVLLLGRSESLVRPADHGLVRVADHAYRRSS